MRNVLRNTVAAASFAAAVGTLGLAIPAAAQSDPHQHEPAAQAAGKPAPGMGGMMGGQGMGMGGMMGCPMMGGGGMGSAMPHLPPGNEKLELQMHADMMKAMADVLAKYAARLPDRK